MSTVSVSIVWRAGQLRSLTHGHIGHAFIPPTNHLASANLELERLATISRRIKFLPIGQSAYIIQKGNKLELVNCIR